jgi:hypothetical protein
VIYESGSVYDAVFSPGGPVNRAVNEAVDVAVDEAVYWEVYEAVYEAGAGALNHALDAPTLTAVERHVRRAT